jgi:hypothetical protein
MRLKNRTIEDTHTCVNIYGGFIILFIA